METKGLEYHITNIEVSNFGDFEPELQFDTICKTFMFDGRKTSSTVYMKGHIRCPINQNAIFVPFIIC